MNSILPLNQQPIQVKFSPLQLIAYFFTEVRSDVNANFSSKKEEDFDFEIIQYKVEVSRKKKPDGIEEEIGHERNYWSISLAVCADEETMKEANFPYFFRFNVTGLFSTKKSKDNGMEERFARINGPSILYGIIRELASTLFSKGPVSAPSLPTVSFYYEQPKVEEK